MVLVFIEKSQLDHHILIGLNWIFILENV